jgi:hypothetical protein
VSTDNQPEAAEADPLVRFRNWPGFLAAAVAVNLLFLWGMWGAVSDPVQALLVKSFSWLPFNVITTILYYVFKVKLADRPGGAIYGALCLVMVVVNWAAMFIA